MTTKAFIISDGDRYMIISRPELRGCFRPNINSHVSLFKAVQDCPVFAFSFSSHVIFCGASLNNCLFHVSWICTACFLCSRVSAFS